MATIDAADKIVRFSDAVDVEIFYVDRSQASKKKLWYSQMDVDIFQAWAERCVQKLRSASQNYCSRMRGNRHHEHVLLHGSDIIGLEKYSNMDLSTEYKLRHKAVVKAVLDEQRRQKVIRHHNIDRLARAALDKSRWARDNARSAGLFLERDMDDEFSDDEGHYLASRVQPRQTQYVPMHAVIKQAPPASSIPPSIHQNIPKRLRSC